MKRLRTFVVGAAAATALAAPTAASAAGPYATGPDPTVASLRASAGPFGVTRTVYADSVTPGFGAATVYAPNVTGRTFGVVAFAPGFTETTSAVSWLAARAATFGFVTIAFNVNNTLTDLPFSRGQQLQAALSFVTTQSREAGRADASRLAVAGHSMGGGATLFASRDLPTLKAAVGLAPWSPGASFDDVTVPSLEIAAQNDIIAPINDNARPLYRSLPAGTPKQYVELKGADHFVTNSPSAKVAAPTIAWLKRWVDDDARYAAFTCVNRSEILLSELSGYTFASC